MEEKKSVYQVTQKIIYSMENLISTSPGKAMLANIRNSIGREVGSMEVWKILFENLPEEFLGTRGVLSSEEKSILLTLQLFAIHQQGKDTSVNTNEKKNLGQSLRVLRGGNSAAIDSRFNTMITSDSFEELTHHLRQMIKLLSSKYKDEKINYPLLSNYLYWFLRGKRDVLRISWSRSYYGYNNVENKGEKNEK